MLINVLLILSNSLINCTCSFLTFSLKCYNNQLIIKVDVLPPVDYWCQSSPFMCLSLIMQVNKQPTYLITITEKSHLTSSDYDQYYNVILNHKTHLGGQRALIGSEQCDMIYEWHRSPVGTSQSVKAKSIQINHFLNRKEGETALKSLSSCSLL